MKIAHLISGGVDSSVALRLLEEQGHDITAFYLKIWLESELSHLGECPWEEDLQFVKTICKETSTPLKILSLQREYWEKIVSYTIRELKEGRTPNSDVFCNRLIKFGIFFDKIDQSYQKVTSGHYAQVVENEGSYLLKRSNDIVKDQTYFLSYMRQDQIARALFPLGSYNKKQVRDLAKFYDLPNKNRKDSQGICFLGQVKYSEFVKYHLGEKPGDFINTDDGSILGQHKGYWFYTIGQRQGLGLSGGPWYVVTKDISNNLIYLSRSDFVENKLCNHFFVDRINWISGSAPPGKMFQVKVRHGPEQYQCELVLSGKNSGEVYLEKADQGIASGQFAAFYEGDICLGSGIIQGTFGKILP
jgi:tRNA (5-methylaminomethyl-2-thiouridylate)-methyltransferase